MLSESFFIRMKSILGSEYDDFVAELEKSSGKSVAIKRLGSWVA